MHEPDDRLAGDPIWELFTGPAPTPASHHLGPWLAAAVLVAAAWVVSPPLAILTAGLAVSLGEFRKGLQLRRTIPDKAGGSICALFRYAWGAWRLGVAAFVLMFVTVCNASGEGGASDPPHAFFAAALLWFAGFVASAILTAAGLVRAFRSGMRVWLGEGVNQARTLMVFMLLVGFTFGVLVPLCILLAAHGPVPVDHRVAVVLTVGILVLQLGSPVLILLLVDWFSHRILADRPAKFGPKVPTVGKWDG